MGNGKRLGTTKASSIEETTAGIISEVLAELRSRTVTSPVEIKIEKLQLTIETKQHEHKYFIVSPQSLKTPEYTKLAALGEFSETSSNAPDEDMRKWRHEVEAFDRMRDRLWNDRKLRNKFVAIRNGQVVGSDTNKFDLARRIRHRFPDEVVLIERVQRGERIVEMPSPELE